MLAVGTYIRALRDAQQLSRAEIAHRVGTHESQIVRIEAGEQDTRGSQLIALVQAVGGDFGEVAELMLAESASVEDARTLAQRRFQRLPADVATGAFARLALAVPELAPFLQEFSELTPRQRQLILQATQSYLALVTDAQKRDQLLP